mmetsp:Transcript_48822/g.156138  ORF Transcript_48822/g.156138 Transcript_48822/m.156138 type:complete len:260 (+) Transcript_48822:452-1231(+)
MFARHRHGAAFPLGPPCQNLHIALGSNLHGDGGRASMRDAQAAEHARRACHELLHREVPLLGKRTSDGPRGGGNPVNLGVLLGEVSEVHLTDDLGVLVVAQLPADRDAAAAPVVVRADRPVDVLLLEVAVVVGQHGDEGPEGPRDLAADVHDAGSGGELAGREQPVHEHGVAHRVDDHGVRDAVAARVPLRGGQAARVQAEAVEGGERGHGSLDGAELAQVEDDEVVEGLALARLLDQLGYGRLRLLCRPGGQHKLGHL